MPLSLMSGKAIIMRTPLVTSGLLQRAEHGFAPTALGVQYLQTRSRVLRNEIVVRQLLMRPTYRAIFEQLLHLPTLRCRSY